MSKQQHKVYPKFENIFIGVTSHRRRSGAHHGWLSYTPGPSTKINVKYQF